MTFWLAAAGLLLLAVAAVAWGALAAPRARPADADTRLYRQRLDELAEDVETGMLDRKAAEGIAAELGRATLAERHAPAAAAAPGRAQRVSAIVLAALLVPAIALPVYLSLGRPDLATRDPDAPADLAHASIEELTAQLQARVEAAPEDPEARQWLARVYMAGGQYGKAVDEFAKLHELLGDTPALLLQWADALAMLNGGRLAGRPAELVARALALEPDDITALWLSGLAAEEAGDRAQALGHLRRAREVSAAAHQPVEDLDRAIAALAGTAATLDAPGDAAAEDLVPDGAAVPGGAPAGADASASAGVASPAAPEAGNAAPPRIEVQVAVSDAVAARIAPDATLFVVARAAPGGPAVPLAVKRLAARELPATVTLDDSLAMAPGMNLSSAREVMLVARVSQSGEPMPQPGDLEGRAGPVAVRGGPEPVRITISEIVE